MYYTAMGQIVKDNIALQRLLNQLSIAPGDPESPEYAAWEDAYFMIVYDENPHPDIRQWATLIADDPDACMTVGLDEWLAYDVQTLDIVTALRADTEAALEMLFPEGTDQTLRPDLDALLEQLEIERDFTQRAHNRDVAMVEQIEAWLADHPGERMMVMIGAGHTVWMEQTLEVDGYPTVALSPTSLCDETRAVALNDAEYDTKMAGQSLDIVSGFGAGAVLNSIIPRSFLTYPEGQVKLALYQAAVLATEGLRNDPPATLAAIFDDVPLPSGVTVDVNSLEEVEPGRYTFAVDISVDGIELERVYIGVATDVRDGVVNNYDLEELLLMKLDEVTSNGERQSVQESGLVEAAPNVIASFSPQRGEAAATIRRAS